MNGPKRLRDLYGDDEFGAAFRSADGDAPSPRSKAALLTALGITTAIVSTAPPAIGAATAGAAATGGTTAGVAAKIGGASLLAKWVVGSALVVSSTVAVSYVAVKPALEERAIEAPPAASAMRARPAPSAPEATRATRPARAEIAAPALDPIAPLPDPVAASPAPSPEPSSELSPEPKPAPPPVATATTPRVEKLAPPPAVATHAPIAEAPPARVADERAPIAEAPTETRPAAAPIAEPAPPRPSSLAPELAALEKARALLASGNAGGALAALDAYAAAFPRGKLAQEAEMIRIDALIRSGQRAAGEARARAFLARLPESPQAARLRAILGIASHGETK